MDQDKFKDLPPIPPMPEFDENEEVPNLLEQPDPQKWLRQPPRVMRGNAKDAFKLGAMAEKMHCTCWNKRCPYYGNCRKCIVFHMALKQIPTCQREMISELYLDGHLAYDLYITEPPKEPTK